MDVIRLLLLILPFIFPFFFLSSFQKLKFFVVTLFSGTVRPRRFNLGTHVDSGQMYHVYWNQAVATYLSLYFFIVLSNFQTLKPSVTLFSETVRPIMLKHRWTMGGYNQAAAAYLSLYFFIFLSLQFSNIEIFCCHTLFSRTVRPSRLKLGTHMDSVQMYRVYWNQAAAAHSSLYFFIFLSNFQTLIFFITLSQEL